MPSLLQPPRPAETDRDYVVVVTRMKVRTVPTAWRFFRALAPVQAQMRGASGLLGWGLRARLLRMTFSTYAVFESRRAMAEFVGGGAHAEVMRRLRGRLAHAEAVTVSMAGRDLPSGWGEIHAVIDDHAATATVAAQHST